MASSQEAFNLLSYGMQKWVSKQGWNSFRDIQSESIVSLLSTNDKPNLVISASTASGKTEAAFLPSLSIVQQHLDAKESSFVPLLYIAPLKALINDQHRRLSDMSTDIGLDCYLWHGDAPQGQKSKLLKQHDGALLITPESLESFLMNRGSWCSRYLTPLVIVIDEFHAFLGSGRGKQLMSLLDRIDMICAQNNRPPATRIGLSATLSQLDVVGNILSPRNQYKIIDATQSKSDVLDIKVKTFPPKISEAAIKKRDTTDIIAIGKEIIQQSLGEKTLTFAGSRRQVETISSIINDICKADDINSEAFPHHGSLSKETREALEHRLVSTEKPTMAIATITLELGIDIGDINQVFQVGAANSVASLRQRIGRSGRRDGNKKAECLVNGNIDPANMEKELLTTIAEIELMEAGWFEPPSHGRRDVSVLVSEILSVLKQYGNAYEDDLYNLLVINGAFMNVPRDLFSMIIADMIEKDFLFVDQDKLLMIGEAGENEINDWKFYATFMSDEAYKVKEGNKIIGEIMPPDASLIALQNGGTFMLGGRYWKVLPPIDMKGKVINVQSTPQRSKFLVPTGGGSGDVCGRIKRTVIKLLNGSLKDYVPKYLDEEGKQRLEKAREYAAAHQLNGLGISLFDSGEKSHETESETKERISRGYNQQALIFVSPPVDPPAMTFIEKCLEFCGMESGGLEEGMPLWRLDELVEAVLNEWDAIIRNKEELLDKVIIEDIKTSEKYNIVLDDETLKYAYVDEKLDENEALKWFETYIRFREQ